MTTQEHQQTGTSNVDYNLVSVIYHSLESALSSSIYVTDAQWVGDQELARFFMNNMQEDKGCADKAEHLLSHRLSKSHDQKQGQQGQQGQQDQQQSQQSQHQQGQFGGGYGYGRGLYGGGYGYGPGMYGGGYGYGRGLYGSYGPGMYGGGYGPGMYGGGLGNQFGGFGGGLYSGQFGGGQFGGYGTPALRQITGTSDVTYDLISTLYHAADAALMYHKYSEDAQNANDQDVVKFLQNLQDRYKQRAEQTKQLLAPRLSHKMWRMHQFHHTHQSEQQGQPAGAGSSSQSSGSGS